NGRTRRKPTASSANGSTLTATIRRVSGDIDGQRSRHPRKATGRGAGAGRGSFPEVQHRWGAGGDLFPEVQPGWAAGVTSGAGASAAAGFDSAVAVSISDAIERFDLREF